MSANRNRNSILAILIFAAVLFQGCMSAKEEATAPEPSTKSPAQTANRTEVEEPKMAQPEIAQPDAARPKAARPKALQPKPAEATAARPKAAQPKAAQPKAAMPKAAMPKAARPKSFKYQVSPDDAATAPMAAPIERDDAKPQAAAAEPAKDDIESKDGYKIVKVFYGTDRAAIEPGPWSRLGAISWGYLAVAALAIAFVFLIVRLITRRRWVTVLFALFVLASIGLCVLSFLIPRITKPADVQLATTYGNRRGTLEVGTCEVSIPEIHKVGELEQPSIFRFEFNEDPKRHVVLLSVNREKPQEFFDELKQQVSKSGKRQTFVFVHGYNVTFEGAARRTAQLKYDLDFDGPAIFYSWPSQGGLVQYTVDETNVAWTVAHLEEFLADIVEKTGAQRVHLIAHSMGNRALTSALERLSRRLKPQDVPMFNEVVLTAPDIDAEVFRRDIAPAIVKTARRVTLYASSNDGALAASKKIHGYPRAGESGADVVIIPGIDTIDVSEIDTSLLGHTYYGDNDTVITDIVQLIHESKPPNLRSRLQAARLNGLKYWVFLTEGNRQP